MPLVRNLLLVAACCCALPSRPTWALDASELAVIINTADPLSVRVGEYYAGARRLSFQNIVRVSFPPGRPALDRSEFEAIKSSVDKRLMPKVQAIALTWVQPYRVQCMSITSAFAFGYDPAFCEPGCQPTRRSAYFNARTGQPFSRLGIRPTMAIAATSFDEARALIDRGVAADARMPLGTAYLLSTTDRARNVRSSTFPLAQRILNQAGVRAISLTRDKLENADDVLFYFTGATSVPGLDTLKFVPGAIADHLTSSGGVLAGPNGQMSALRWLEAGATASYGTVVEPCNLRQKFPDPSLVAAHYLSGDTAIEAYWKSVAMPGQGIFIGEPLAAPFRKTTTDPRWFAGARR